MIRQLAARIIVLVLILALTVLCFSGCSGSSEKVLYYRSFSEKSVDSGTVAENEGYILKWDNDKKCVLMHDKLTGKVWSTIPYDFYTSENAEGIPLVRMHSPLILKYSESNTLQTKTVYAYADCISDNTVTSRSVKNGIEVTYYFERQQISVPVQYLLTQKGLEVRLMVEQIRESRNIVCEVSLAPFMCSVKSGGEGYLVLPSGSGALMYTDQGEREPRSFKAAVYGEDENTTDNSILNSAKAVKMPFFGVVTSDSAMCAVIKNGAESAFIEASAGDGEVGWSSAWATFALRGYSLIQRTTIDGTTDVAAYYTASHVYSKYFSVGYYPVHTENSYTAVAKCYAEHLGLNDKKADAKDTPIYLQMLGAVNTDELFLGIPYKKLTAVTDFDAAKRIIKHVYELTDTKPTVQLLGFTESGIEYGAPMGGLDFAKQLGGNKGYKALKEYCDKSGIPFYADYDFIHYTGSGSGISKANAALSAKGTVLRRAHYSVSSRNVIEGKDYFLLGFDAFRDAATTLTTHLVKNDIKAVSLSSLTSGSYSDYTKTNGYAKNGFGVNTENVMKLLSMNNIKIASNSANDYAIKKSACVFEAPMLADTSFAADEQVPLYSIVFKGHIPMSVESINLADDSREMLLKAVETGSGLCFTIANDCESGMSSDQHTAVPFSQWKSIKDDISDMYAETKDVLGAVSGVAVSNHTVLQKGVHRTDFSNGISITVNFTDSHYTDENGTVEPKSFTLRGNDAI